jgi:hypothetical protein
LYFILKASTPHKNAPQFDCTVGGLLHVTHDISDEEINENTVCIKKVSKVKGRSYFFWTFVEIFENEEKAYDKLSVLNWIFKQNTQSSEGDKSFFKCGINKKCKAGYQFVYNTENMSISAFTNNVEHDHEWEDDTEWGIPKSTKKIINELYDSGIIKPMLIIYELRRKSIAEPNVKQINNYLNGYRKKNQASQKSVIMI